MLNELAALATIVGFFFVIVPKDLSFDKVLDFLFSFRFPGLMLATVFSSAFLTKCINVFDIVAFSYTFFIVAWVIFSLSYLLFITPAYYLELNSDLRTRKTFKSVFFDSLEFIAMLSGLFLLCVIFVWITSILFEWAAI